MIFELIQNPYLTQSEPRKIELTVRIASAATEPP